MRFQKDPDTCGRGLREKVEATKTTRREEYAAHLGILPLLTYGLLGVSN